jgi:hypothetical protein
VSHTLTVRENHSGLSLTLTARKKSTTCTLPDWLEIQTPRSLKEKKKKIFFAATIGRAENLIDAQIGQIC